MKKAEAILAWAVDKMEERYDLLSRAACAASPATTNWRHEEILPPRAARGRRGTQDRIPEKMPYIVIFVDEWPT